MIAPDFDPTAALIAGWLTARLGLQVNRQQVDADRILAVKLELADGSHVDLTRNGEAGTATLSRTGLPDRTLPLGRRPLGEELAEELRRLDADLTYAAALAGATGVDALDDRPATRVHIWKDPALAERPEKEKSGAAA